MITEMCDKERMNNALRYWKSGCFRKLTWLQKFVGVERGAEGGRKVEKFEFNLREFYVLAGYMHLKLCKRNKT